MTLAEMPNSGEMKLEGTPPVDRHSPQLRQGAMYPSSKFFDPELFLSKRNAGTKMEQRLKERPSRDGPNLGSTWAAKV